MVITLLTPHALAQVGPSGAKRELPSHAQNLAMSQRQDWASIDAKLDGARRELVLARLSGSDIIQTTGGLSSERMDAVDKMAGQIYLLWGACIVSHIDREMANPAPNSYIVVAAMSSCTVYKDEFVAWIRFGGQAHHFETPPSEIAESVRQREAMYNGQAVDRLIRERGAR